MIRSSDWKSASIVKDIIALDMGLHVSDGHVEELLETHIKELQELEKDEHKIRMDILSSSFKEEEMEEQSLNNPISIGWNDQTMLYFRNCLKIEAIL